ncbi:hypothetical protein BD560DRAFT_427301 [Blakeslea trispora]|nr:hypothetical protein BD560DRAFT_427301 [Blakeslea trispora]
MTRDALLKTITPFPCLNRVFSFLSKPDLLQAALVCRQWHLEFSKKTWSSFKFSREREFERIFSIVAKRTTTVQYGNFITSLELVHSDKDFSINSSHIMLVTALCPNLLSVSLTFQQTHAVAPPVASHLLMNHDSVYEMAKYMTSGSLEKIVFNSCSTIQTSTLCKLAITNPQLKSIEIMGSTPISDSGLATLVDKCSNTLELLSIGNAYQLTDKSLRYIAFRCKRIRQICIFNNNTERVSEDTLTAIITHCPTLETISLSDSRCLGFTFFDAVVQRIKTEMTSIHLYQASPHSGLQRLCLGGVKRDIIHSQLMKELIDKSANKNDADSNDHDGNDDLIENQLTHFMDTTKFMPKSTVIRGNTIWWQRQRMVAHTA